VVTRDPGHAESWRNLAVLLKQQARPAEALTVCRSGLAHLPDEAELLLLHGVLLHELGDLAGAEGTLLRLLEPRPTRENGLKSRQRRATARHHLALVCRAAGREFEAEAHWRAALVECPDFAAALLGLGEVYLEQGRGGEAEDVVARLEQLPQAGVDGAVLRARLHLARQEYRAARRLLEDTVARAPRHLAARVFLSYTLLQEGRDWDAAERALRDVLALDPSNAEARHNLSTLLRQQAPPMQTTE
jgi:tetratricopeptide (TPR) repeat protein